jgi:hypothetical protein
VFLDPAIATPPMVAPVTRTVAAATVIVLLISICFTSSCCSPRVWKLVDGFSVSGF